MTLVLAPSGQVPLDREAADEGSTVPGVDPAPVAAATKERSAPAEDEHLRPRVRELEGVVARERQVAHDAERARDEVGRAQAIAVADRDRAIAQLEESVIDREAAVRTRARMEAERDEAILQRDAAIADRDESRAQRDEVLLAHRALRRRLKAERVHSERRQEAPQPPSDGVAQQPHAGVSQPPSAAPRAVRTVAAQLHRAGRELGRGQGNGLTQWDMWVVRILGTVAALAFISLLVMILKAFFVP